MTRHAATVSRKGRLREERSGKEESMVLLVSCFIAARLLCTADGSPLVTSGCPSDRGVLENSYIGTSYRLPANHVVKLVSG